MLLIDLHAMYADRMSHARDKYVRKLVVVVVVVVDFGLTTLLTSQVISGAFNSEREKSDKFCLEALISA